MRSGRKEEKLNRLELPNRIQVVLYAAIIGKGILFLTWEIVTTIKNM